MNYFQIEQPMNTLSWPHWCQLQTLWFRAFSFNSLIFLIKKKILNLGLLEVKACALDVTDIPKKNQPKPEFYHGIYFSNWHKWQEKEPTKVTFKQLLQKKTQTSKTFLLIIWLGSFTYTILDFFYMQKQSSIWL